MLLAITLFQASIAANTADFLTRPPASHESAMFDVLNVGDAAGQIDTPARLALLKAGFGIVLPELGARWLDKRGHRTHATLLRCVAVGLPAYGTYTNVRGKIRRGEWRVSLRLGF